MLYFLWWGKRVINISQFAVFIIYAETGPSFCECAPVAYTACCFVWVINILHSCQEQAVLFQLFILIIMICSFCIAHNTLQCTFLCTCIYYPGRYWYSSNPYNYLVHHLNSPGSMLAESSHMIAPRLIN